VGRFDLGGFTTVAHCDDLRALWSNSGGVAVSIQCAVKVSLWDTGGGEVLTWGQQWKERLQIQHWRCSGKLRWRGRKQDRVSGKDGKLSALRDQGAREGVEIVCCPTGK